MSILVLKTTVPSRQSGAGVLFVVFAVACTSCSQTPPVAIHVAPSGKTQSGTTVAFGASSAAQEGKPGESLSFQPTGTPRSNRLAYACKLGVLRPEQMVPVEIVLRNTSESAWAIRQVRLSCACLDARLSTRAVSPGASVTLKVAIRIGTVSKNESQVITLPLDGGPTEALEVVLSYFVRDSLVISQDPLELKLDVGKGKEVLLDVFNFDAGDWAALQATTSSPALRAVVNPRPLSLAEFEGDVRPRQWWKVTVASNPHSTPGIYHETIELVAEGGSRIVRTLPVTVNVADPVSFAPGQLFLGKLVRGESTERSVILRLADPARVPSSTEDFAFSSPLDDALVVGATRLSGGSEGQYWRLDCRLALPADAAVGFRRTALEVSIRTPHETIQRMLPVVFSVE